MNPAIPVLDHGYVRLIETWGHGDASESEAGIIEAARQSTQGSFRGWDTDAKLLAFLYNAKPPHSTPFEFAGIVIEVQAPIFVFREWMRHRTQCLAGDTEISLISPRGSSFKRKIKDIFDLKHGRPAGSGPACHRNGYSKTGTPVTRRPRNIDPAHVGALPNCQSRLLRVIDEDSGTVSILPMADVWASGTKEVFEVETAFGHVVKCSASHPFFTREGWANVSDLSVGIYTGRHGKVARNERPIPPSLRQGIGVWTTMMRSRIIRETDDCYVCGRTFAFNDLELDHVEPVYMNLRRALDEENLRPICSKCHRLKTNTEQVGAKTRMGVRWDRIVRIERVGEEATFDVEVDGPHKNFVANGLIVHNSYNELSARYAPVPNVNYVPTVERIMLGANATSNRQAGTIKGAARIDEVAARAFQRRLRSDYESFEEAYQMALSTGVPKELARCGMPVGRYSRMRAATCLRNWLAFLTLRQDPGAQFEIQQFANAVGSIVAAEFPRTWALFHPGGAL